MFFDPGRTYKFRHLQNSGLVRDRDDLKTKQEKFSFPLGRLLTPRDRQWTGKELNNYLETRPATQAEFAKQFSDRPREKVIIPKKAPAQPANERAAMRRRAAP
jgi:hypothetical protein